MKKILLILAAIFMLPCANAAPEFKEGVNYDVLKQTATAQPEVLEFFSYYCPPCAKFEPIVEQLQHDLPKEVAIKKNPVAFFGRDMAQEMQRAYATATLLNVESKLTPSLFHKIQVQRQAPQNRDDIKKLFVENGVQVEAFDNTVDSFAVSSMVSQFDRNTEKYNIRSTPTFIVNGKYMIKIESISSQEQFTQLIKYLLAKDA